MMEAVASGHSPIDCSPQAEFLICEIFAKVFLFTSKESSLKRSSRPPISLPRNLQTNLPIALNFSKTRSLWGASGNSSVRSCPAQCS
jgi:hypothetical protein